MEMQITNKKGEVFTVLYDAEDHWIISQYTWHVVKSHKGNRIYVRTGSAAAIRAGIPVLIHRLIMNVNDPVVFIDHADGCGTNNQRSNLRIATRSQNAANSIQRKSPHSTYRSKYKGVRLEKKGGNWKATIMVNGASIHLGTYQEEIEAAYVYNRAAIENFGVYAKLNDLQGWEPQNGLLPERMFFHNPVGFRGVKKAHGKFVAEIGFKLKKIYLGRYDLAEDAARAYNFMSRKLFGEKGFLNSVEPLFPKKDVDPNDFFLNSRVGLRGVTYCKNSGKWNACIYVDSKRKSLGYFTDPKEAALAHDRAALQLKGPNAKINYPELARHTE